MRNFYLDELRKMLRHEINKQKRILMAQYFSAGFVTGWLAVFLIKSL
jgi:hypothetical protein